MLRAKYKTFLGFCAALLLGTGVIFSIHIASGDNSKSLPEIQAQLLNIQPPENIEQAKQWIKTGQDLVAIPRDFWRNMLSDDEYYVMWEKGTERAFTGKLLNENREGVFVSAGCRLPVFKSAHKYKAGTGWPSFWDVFDENNIILKEDSSWGMRRIEVLSACGEHLGHVFEDGPKPTGLRYCINSKALDFVPAGEQDPLGPLDLRQPNPLD